MSALTPSPQDIAWTKRQIDMLVVGGVWAFTSAPIILKKTAEKTLSVVSASPFMVPGRVYDPTGLEREVQKVRACVEAAGYKFEDLRQ